jgi:ABC-type sugar transport system ATPase subunit
MVYQEFALAPHLTVAQNLFLGREPGRGGLLDRRGETRRAREMLEQVGLEVDPDRRVASLPVAARQRVEIAKALAIEAKLVILDEPTAVLPEGDIDDLFGVIERLKARGIAILYISHRLEEIFRIGDRVTVLRDGAVVDTRPVAELDHDRLVALMVGREIANLYPKPEVELGDVRLRATGFTRGGTLADCSLEVRAGEIVGLAGIVGAGRTELARAVFGADPVDAGTVELDGETRRIDSPSAAIAAGVGYLTEDRKGNGLALQLGVAPNITLAHLPARGPLLDLGREREIAARRRDQLHIRTPSLSRRVEALSGGNQQKVMVAKWLEASSRVLFFDEPARGIDVGAKAEMFELIGRLAADGRAIVLISSYLPELLNMCDRILVMREGRIAGEVGRADFTEERVMALATGAKEG